MANEKVVKQCVKVLSALGEPTRMRILDILLEGASSVGEIANAVQVPIVNTSIHLKVLKEAGLLENEKRGRFMFYSVIEDFKNGVIEIGWCKVTIAE